jgi:hypothetical protein
MAPTLAPSLAPSQDSVQQEITQITENLDKLENKKLASQRFVPSVEKSENLSKLALGAKLERALDRRLGSQDAVMRPRKPKNQGKYVPIVVKGDKGEVVDEKAGMA